MGIRPSGKQVCHSPALKFLRPPGGLKKKSAGQISDFMLFLVITYLTSYVEIVDTPAFGRTVLYVPHTRARPGGWWSRAPRSRLDHIPGPGAPAAVLPWTAGCAAAVATCPRPAVRIFLRGGPYTLSLPHCPPEITPENATAFPG